MNKFCFSQASMNGAPPLGAVQRLLHLWPATGSPGHRLLFLGWARFYGDSFGTRFGNLIFDMKLKTSIKAKVSCFVRKGFKALVSFRKRFNLKWVAPAWIRLDSNIQVGRHQIKTYDKSPCTRPAFLEGAPASTSKEMAERPGLSTGGSLWSRCESPWNQVSFEMINIGSLQSFVDGPLQSHSFVFHDFWTWKNRSWDPQNALGKHADPFAWWLFGC